MIAPGPDPDKAHRLAPDHQTNPGASPMFESVLVANRGEIAIRVIRACHELGVRAVAVHSAADRHAPHVAQADEAWALDAATSAGGYLDIDQLVDIARAAKVDAVHPGYGFLAENAAFAQACAEAGLTFVGPRPETIAELGDKVASRAAAQRASVPVIPGTTGTVTDATQPLRLAEDVGWPIAIKAAFGGGGRGMKVVYDAAAVQDTLDSARREADASFGRGECYVERYLPNPRHVEVQVLGDHDGRVIHLGDRDCSLQRRHQKLLEEAPAPGLTDSVRVAMIDAAIRLAQEVGYVNAGTCEFLLDEDGETFYFLEMNTRLQVEHPVTELVTGVDLVHEQLRIAAGDGLRLKQRDISMRGHAIEVRINTEDPARDFAPSPGRITDLHRPDGPGVRFDHAARVGLEVLPDYDSLLGKLVVWAEDRETASRRMRRALDELQVTGPSTTTAFHRFAIEHPDFRRAEHTTASVTRDWDVGELASARPAPSDLHAAGQDDEEPTRRLVTLHPGGHPISVAVPGRTRQRAANGALNSTAGRPGSLTPRGDQPGDERALRAPLQGTLTKCAVKVGDEVRQGDVVCVLEAMKMENAITAHRAGRITSMPQVPGDAVEQGAVIAMIHPPDDEAVARS